MHLLEIGKEHKPFLATIRHWSNVKIAFSETAIWLKDFTDDQLKSANLLQIPHLTIYVVKDNLLFRKGSLLPSKKAPSALLWSPIQKGLPVALPGLNHNYFGIHEKVSVSLTASETEREAFALLTNYASAQQYIQTAPEVRLQSLQWIVLEDKVLFLGTPILPLQGTTFWKRNDILLPSGYDFDLPVLSDILMHSINPEKENWIVWFEDNSYGLIPKASIKPLSISSLRLTV